MQQLTVIFRNLAALDIEIVHSTVTTYLAI